MREREKVRGIRVRDEVHRPPSHRLFDRMLGTENATVSLLPCPTRSTLSTEIEDGNREGEAPSDSLLCARLPLPSISRRMEGKAMMVREYTPRGRPKSPKSKHSMSMKERLEAQIETDTANVRRVESHSRTTSPRSKSRDGYKSSSPTEIVSAAPCSSVFSFATKKMQKNMCETMLQRSETKGRSLTARISALRHSKLRLAGRGGAIHPRWDNDRKSHSNAPSLLQNNKILGVASHVSKSDFVTVFHAMSRQEEKLHTIRTETLEREIYEIPQRHDFCPAEFGHDQDFRLRLSVPQSLDLRLGVAQDQAQVRGSWISEQRNKEYVDYGTKNLGTFRLSRVRVPEFQRERCCHPHDFDTLVKPISKGDEMGTRQKFEMLAREPDPEPKWIEKHFEEQARRLGLCVAEPLLHLHFRPSGPQDRVDMCELHASV